MSFSNIQSCMKLRYPLLFIAILLIGVETGVESFSAVSKIPPTRVIVTGAGSSVGYIVFQKLLKSKNFYPVGLVRDKRGAKRLSKLGADPQQVFKGDITNKDSLTGLFNGASKAILCTSARPKKRLRYRIKNLFRRIFRRESQNPSGKELYYKSNEEPYLVDYVGQRNVIDLAVKNKLEHVVMLGNMGGYRGSKLNAIGRREDETDPRKGNILKWKRAAERYLMKRCFFTIVHAGALTDEKGGEREIVWDTDDALLRTSFRRIPREDVAEVLIQALIHREAIGRSVDVASRPKGQGMGPTRDWLRFWARPGDCLYPYDPDDEPGL